MPRGETWDEQIACFGQERVWPNSRDRHKSDLEVYNFFVPFSRTVGCYGMDTWPPTIVCNSTQGEKNRKGKAKATILPYPLLEGGSLTSATLREDGNRLEWVTAQGRASSTTDNVRSSDTLLTPTRVGRKLVCNKEVALAFPATQSPHLRPRTTSLLQRAEQGVRALDTMPFCNSSHIMLGAFPSHVLSGCGHPRGTYT